MPTIDSLLAEPKLLPQIPEVMRDLIQTFNEKDPDLLKISKLINKDPVISAKLLRLANSAKFGSSRQIGTVNEAAVRLGLAMVRNMVLACGLTESVTAVPGIDLKHFWGCVFNVAELARRLAVKKGMKGDEVFTCALLYDLGRLVMHVGLPENTVHHIHDLELHKGRAKAEELVVGFNYAQVGAAMARYWKFPETISNAVEYHYNPMLAKEFLRRGRVDPSGDRAGCAIRCGGRGATRVAPQGGRCIGAELGRLRCPVHCAARAG